MLLNTESSEGLVIWHGNLSGMKKDFLAIAINDGYPTLTFTLGSGPNVAVGASRINDGLDHWVEIYIQGRTASIKVDHGVMTSVEAKGSQEHLEHLGSWHIGGLRDLDVETGGWFHKGFTGCIKSFFVQKKRINFQKDSIKTANLVIIIVPTTVIINEWRPFTLLVNARLPFISVDLSYRRLPNLYSCFDCWSLLASLLVTT